MTATLSATFPNFVISPSRTLPMSLSGWAHFPVHHCDVYRPERQSDVARLMNDSRSIIARGLGRSFGDASLNHGGAVMMQTRLNRFLSFDAETGTLKCEAGVSISEILETFLPRGYCLAVSPGTRFVTIGGAIASDVHGKNHLNAGSFGAIVEEIELATPVGKKTCSRENDPELFWATVGGMGLTGTVLTATIKLRKVETAYMRCEYTRLPDLDATLREFLDRENAGHEYAIAWIDCLAKGRSLGRSVLMRADHATQQDLFESSGNNPLRMNVRPAFVLPQKLPCLLNAFTARLFNSFYYLTHRPGHRLVGFHEFLYAMDAVTNWNSSYGRRGFIEHQCVIPTRFARQAFVELFETCARSERNAFLASIKAFGEADPGILSFPRRGFTLVLDLPVRKGLRELVTKLDAIVMRHGGSIYLAKDALLDPESFQAMYPRWSELQRIKCEVDPNMVIQSSLARRVGLA